MTIRSLKHLLSRLKGKLGEIWFRALITLLNWKLGSRPRWATNEQIKTIRFSEVLGITSTIDIDRIYRKWRNADRIWDQGRYFDSVNMKREVLQYLYSVQDTGGEKQVAPFMSFGWGHAIGHIGSLGTFTLGQKLGIIPPIRRYLPVKDESSRYLIGNFLRQEVSLVNSRLGYLTLENPSQWHLSERLQMINTGTEFISLYEMHELVFRDTRVTDGKVSLSLEASYVEFAERQLRTLGLPSGAWFVGMHVREKPNPLDPRLAKVETFYAAVTEIVSRGGWVIRFGADKMNPLPFRENVIDLNTDSEQYKKLHLYIIAKSLFLLTTNSGPSVLAWTLGTPVLQTNTLSIARNILSSSKGSLFLPKKYRVSSDKPCSFSQIISSNEGYAETSLKEKHSLGYQLLDNSEEEILRATIDMFDYLKFGEHNIHLQKQVNEIRKSHGAVGYGTIAPSFLSQNEGWFLK